MPNDKGNLCNNALQYYGVPFLINDTSYAHQNSNVELISFFTTI